MLEPGEQLRLEVRRHGVVLVRPLGAAVAAGIVGIPLAAIGWPFVVPGAVLIGAGAAVALRAVWRWDRTRIVVTTRRLFVVHGTLRRQAVAARLARVPTVEVDEPLIGRLLGYGTLVAGDLEIPYVPHPRELVKLVS